MAKDLVRWGEVVEVKEGDILPNAGLRIDFGVMDDGTKVIMRLQRPCDHVFLTANEAREAAALLLEMVCRLEGDPQRVLS
jgi:hypothetical protein